MLTRPNDLAPAQREISLRMQARPGRIKTLPGLRPTPDLCDPVHGRNPRVSSQRREGWQGRRRFGGSGSVGGGGSARGGDDVRVGEQELGCCRLRGEGSEQRRRVASPSGTGGAAGRG